MVKMMCPQRNDEPIKAIKKDLVQLKVPSRNILADKGRKSRQGEFSESRSPSSVDQDVEIIEMQLDNSNRSIDGQNKWLMPKMSSLKLNRANSITNDLIDFSSLRDHQQDHLIFTSTKPIKQPKIRLENGSIYEGEWMKGQKHGVGKLIWPNGSIYDVVY